MQRVIDIALEGHPRPFRLHQDAYDALQGYLDTARARLGADPDSAEVVGDLERSIGERLAGLAGADGRVLTAADLATVLDEVGAVEAIGSSPAADRTGGSAAGAVPGAGTRRSGRRRRLYRIRQGQDIAGVCIGLAAYSSNDVGWVRTIFVLLALFTGGIWILVYLAMMFILPVVPTYQDWLAVTESEDG